MSEFVCIFVWGHLCLCKDVFNETLHFHVLLALAQKKQLNFASLSTILAGYEVSLASAIDGRFYYFIDTEVLAPLQTLWTFTWNSLCRVEKFPIAFFSCEMLFQATELNWDRYKSSAPSELDLLSKCPPVVAQHYSSESQCTERSNYFWRKWNEPRCAQNHKRPLLVVLNLTKNYKWASCYLCGG